MDIIIPLNGEGKRFKDNGYKIPKALIKCRDKEIIFHLIDNLNTKKINNLYIPYNQEYTSYNFENILINRYPSINFVFLKLEKPTNGAAETVKMILEKIEKDIAILCLDCDNFYICDILSIWNKENSVFYFKDSTEKPIFSYLKVDNNCITDIKEKEKISNFACCGAYGFKSSKELLKYCNFVIEKNIVTKGEFYLSTIIKEMISADISFIGKEIINKDYFTLGIPDNLINHEISFLFDLDGTLVNTDKIYTIIWKEILEKYNIMIDDLFFNEFIQGKSDSDFLIYLIPGITETEIIEISKVKDEKFIEYINKNKINILIEGAKEFIEKNKNKFIGIVTNCNKKSAEFIIKYTGIHEYINLIVSSNDCIASKPDPEPYNNAIKILNLNKEKTIIFEDSMSGYLSAKNSNINRIILLNNKKNKDIDCYKIDNFIDLEIKLNNYNSLLEKEIKNIFRDQQVKEIIKSDNNLKSGYICDIEKYKVLLNNYSIDIIVKISNFNNELSKTARKLDLYNNEIYFYDKLYNIIKINKPKFYGIILKKGIIMENIYKYNGKFNIDLNNNINLLLRIVLDISNMHSEFYFSCKDNMPSIMNNLKRLIEINYYEELINKRFNLFVRKNRLLIKENMIKILIKIDKNFNKNRVIFSKFPLSFCHGDLKSPNIFYKDDNVPYYLDWQYIHLNKGISDITFLLVESVNFDPILCDIVLKYYYKLRNFDYSYDKYMEEFKISLQLFPFFVMVWFNSEDSDNLLDKTFPIRFMKNLLNYYEYYL